MSSLFILPIVEGDGEVEAAPTLLRRIGAELLRVPIDVGKPIRCKRQRLFSPRHDDLRRALGLARLKLAEAKLAPDARRIALLLLDADDDLPCRLAPDLLRSAAELQADLDVACVLANPEFETWFVAAADSLVQAGRLTATGEPAPAAPERSRSKKAWIERRIAGISYQPIPDQKRLASAMDLAECRRKSPSFDKLCRELERRVPDR